MSWTPETVDALRRMWAEGLTSAQIAERLGITRNAVCGKANRIGVAARPSPIRKSLGPKEPPKPKVVKLKVVKTVLPQPPRVFAMKLGKVTACRWPEGDPKEAGFHFCEAKTEPGRPYCQPHCERAYYRPHEENTRRMAAE